MQLLGAALVPSRSIRDYVTVIAVAPTPQPCPLLTLIQALDKGVIGKVRSDDVPSAVGQTYDISEQRLSAKYIKVNPMFTCWLPVATGH